MTTLTEAVIRKVAPNARADIVAGLVAAQNELNAAGLNTKARLAHFLAQICTETGGLQHTEENLNYSAERMIVVFPNRFKTLADAAPFAHNPEKFANKVYGGRLGNNANGDGFKYRGGGLIQTTGKDNYTAAGFANNPDDLRKMPDALASALKFWTAHGCNAFADKNDITGLRKRVNGGTNGLKECREFHAKAVAALGP
ncbi:MAG TPA: glycoside hydrolase family 19 protein [Beijerinckiaceae bacterium]